MKKTFFLGKLLGLILVSVFLISCAGGTPRLIIGDVAPAINIETIAEDAETTSLIVGPDQKQYLLIKGSNNEEPIYIANLGGDKIKYKIGSFDQSRENIVGSILVGLLTPFGIHQQFASISKLIQKVDISKDWKYLIVSMTSRESIYQQIVYIIDIEKSLIVKKFEPIWKESDQGKRERVAGHDMYMALKVDDQNNLYILGQDIGFGTTKRFLIQYSIDNQVENYEIDIDSSEIGLKRTDLISYMSDRSVYFSSHGKLKKLDTNTNRVEERKFYEDGIIFPIEITKGIIIAKLSAPSKAAIAKIDFANGKIIEEIIAINDGNYPGLGDITGTYDYAGVISEKKGIISVCRKTRDFTSKGA